MRLSAALVPVVVWSINSCSKPAIDPTSAGVTKGVVVCWPERPSQETNQSKLRDAFGAQLRSAGYTLQPKGCDLRTKWTAHRVTWKGVHVYRTATLSLLDAKKKPIEKIDFEIERSHILVSERERLATLFVNAMNSSPKLAEYAASKAKATGEADDEDVSTEEAAAEPETK